MAEVFDLEAKEREFVKNLVAEYLKYGSVDEVFRKNHYSLPISYSAFHRLLDRWGIIKAAGPNCKLTEAICFMTCLSHNQIPLERMYREMPPSFQTSLGTMHRILGHVKEGLVRRVGTALVITQEDEEEKVLVGKDISAPRVAVDGKLGKFFGAISLPMGFSKKSEKAETSILRVLQHEVFSQNAIDQTMPAVIPVDPKPFMYLAIADIGVQVFHLSLPLGLTTNFSSFKLINHRFLPFPQIIEADEKDVFRSGIIEIVRGYKRYLEKDFSQAISETSLVNKELALLFDYSSEI